MIAATMASSVRRALYFLQALTGKAAWRALDPTRAHAARDRAASIEHLEPDHLAHTRGHPLSDS
ncbi:hypothetical protein GCM10010280_60940 [Streptomyces pilosus]|uniref:Uncharacterized protein n=1 Tax=Streptomyces pilosus TaxID=28893 RepID=A0A918F3S1_9ACTN|nr:hypothetical protein GCM10010280_60940 [Streptomyces pilosus]